MKYTTANKVTFESYKGQQNTSVSFLKTCAKLSQLINSDNLCLEQRSIKVKICFKVDLNLIHFK